VDKQQKIALILMPVLAIGILAGGMFMSGKANPASAANYTDGVYEGEGQGFGGAIKVKVEVAGGKITSIELLEHSETGGLGDVGAEAVIANIIAEQKTDVDVHSGATVSSNGVMEAVKNALAAAGGTQSFTDGEFEGEAEGFGGTLKVKVVVEGGKLVSVDILEHAESAGISDPAIEGIPAAMVESQTADVDIASGATVSSNAIIEAVKNALAGGSGEAEETEEVQEVDFSAIEFVDGVYEGAAEGFGGDIKVEVEVKDGKLVRVDILDHAESAGISDPAIEGIPAAMLESQTVDVDIASGATYSSDAIKKAVANAILSADAGSKETSTEAIEFVDGVYEGVAEGFGGDIKVEVEVKDGKLVRVDILDHSESAGIADPAIEGIPAAMLESQTVDVDIASGATYSSEGIINAVKDALTN